MSSGAAGGSDQVFRAINDIGRVIEADLVRGHGADRVEIARVEMRDMVAEAIAIGVRQFRLRPILSAAFFSANSGLVLYLIKARFIIASMAGFGMRNHRVSADRRSALAEGFGRAENICIASTGAAMPDDAFFISTYLRALSHARPLARTSEGLHISRTFR